MLLDEVLLRQSKRKNARKGWQELRSPDIALDQGDYEKKRRELRSEYFAECHGVDADLDLVRRAVRIASERLLTAEGAKPDKDGFYNNGRIMEMENDLVSEAKAQLDPATREQLQRESQKLEAEASKQAKQEKKEADLKAAEEAEKAQIKLTFPAAADGEAVDVEAVDITPESHRLVDHEKRAREAAEQTAVADDEGMKKTTLPPADGFKPEDKENEAQPKKFPKGKAKGKPAAIKKPAKGGKKK